MLDPSVFTQNGFGAKIPISNSEPEGETVDKYNIHEP
jgi:hypothetical protein